MSDGQSHIGLTLTNFRTSEIIKEWKIEKETNSDHAYITFILIYTEDQPNWAQNQKISNTSINF
jgi:hypothetical protein